MRPIHSYTELFSEWKSNGFQIIYIAPNAHSIILLLRILDIEIFSIVNITTSNISRPNRKVESIPAEAAIICLHL